MVDTILNQFIEWMQPGFIWLFTPQEIVPAVYLGIAVFTFFCGVIVRK